MCEVHVVTAARKRKQITLVLRVSVDLSHRGESVGPFTRRQLERGAQSWGEAAHHLLSGHENVHLFIYFSFFKLLP